MPRKLTSTVLYLRTFRGTKSDNDMVAGITEALCGLAKLIIIGSAGAEVSLRRYWSRRYGEGVDHSDRLDYVVSTDDSWRQEVHRQISRANCILFYLAPKRGRFPSPNPSMMSLDKFFSSPLFKGSSGEGLLQEIVYLRRLNKLPQTVLICRREDLENISRTISLAMIDAHSEPARQSGPGRSAAWCGDRGIVMLLVPTVCRALVRLDTSAEEGSSRMGSVTRAGLV